MCAFWADCKTASSWYEKKIVELCKCQSERTSHESLMGKGWSGGATLKLCTMKKGGDFMVTVIIWLK